MRPLMIFTLQNPSVKHGFNPAAFFEVPPDLLIKMISLFDDIKGLKTRHHARNF